jgi:MFS family permease
MQAVGSPGRQRSGAWRNPGVTRGGWLNVAAGAHNALVTSFVPVLLHAAGYGPMIVGWCIASGNIAALAGMMFARRFYHRAPRTTSAIAVLAAGAGLATLGPSASWPLVVGFLLAIAGLGAGALQTLGPGVAAKTVLPPEYGDAITAVGTYRSVAMITAPGIASGLSLIMPLGAAVALLGCGICTVALARRPAAAD